MLKETLSKDIAPKKITLQTFKGILTNRAAFSILLLGFVQFYGYYIFLVFIPRLLDELFAVPMVYKGLFFIPLTAGIVIGTLIGGKIQSKLKHTSILVFTAYGTGLFVVIFWCFLYFKFLTIPALVFFLLGFGVMLGISLPSQITSLVNIFVQEKGTAMGVYNFIRFSGAAIGPLLGSALFKIGGDNALYITLFVFLICGAIVIHRSSYALSHSKG
jgi:MFS transporter, DHA1 family, multidrug resistance protein